MKYPKQIWEKITARLHPLLPLWKAVFPASGWWLTAGLLTVCAGLLYLALSFHFARQSLLVISDLLPGKAESIPSGAWPFKREFLAFGLFQCIYLGLLCLYWLRTLLGLQTWRPRFSVILPELGVLACLGGLLAVPEFIFQIFMGLAALMFFVSVAGFPLPLPKKRFHLSRTVGMLFCAALCVMLLTPAKKAWFPITLPNDYYEFPETFSEQFPLRQPQKIWYPGITQKEYLQALSRASDTEEPSLQAMGRDRVIACAGGVLSGPICDGATERIEYVAQASYWQAATGRLLFHHSLLYVPARHWLSYGIDKSVRCLYGYGNTAFHAVLMMLGGGTLSAYFSTYPIALLTGLLSITLCVGYCGRKWWLYPSAFALCLYGLYSVNFTGAFMAGGSFSPLRYVGLCLQVASVFFCMRGSSRRLVALPLSALFSLFWNAEFGIIGLLCQGLVLLTPQQRLPLWGRFAGIGILFACLVGFKLITRPPDDAIENIFLGFFQVDLPVMRDLHFRQMFSQLLLVQVAAVIGACLFKNGERAARLCILPTVALIMVKAIFNPSEPHLAISLAFTLPMLLLYIPRLQGIAILDRPGVYTALSVLLILVLSALTLHEGRRYVRQSADFRRLFILPYERESWKTLGESIPAVMPEEPLVERVSAIRELMRPEDRLLLLSPMDHLLAFYANPRGFCGFYELLSNTVTEEIVHDAADIVRRYPDVLVVLDDRMFTPCLDLQKLERPVSTCSKDRLVSKNNALRIFAELQPDLEEVARRGELRFFRLRSQSSPLPAEKG